MAGKGDRGGGDSYWLGQGPITRAERKQAFKYLQRHNLPQDERRVKHTVAKLRKRREINRYVKGKEEASTDPSAPWQVVYGDCLIGGTQTFIHTSGPADQPNLYLHMVVTLAAHELYLIRAVYFDDYQLTWNTDLLTRPTGVVTAAGIFAGLVKMQINYGTDGQSALSELVSDVPTKWTSDHRQRGHAHVYLRLKWNETVFKNGTPDIQFRVTGKADVIDPRTGSGSPGASNGAMVLYDYMRNSRFGLGCDATEFNTARLEQACDDCEDSIALAGGGNEFRYLLNGHFGTDQAPGAVIEEMLGAMAGRLPFTEGKFSLWAGKARSGAVVTITADMILSEMQVLTKLPRSENFNAVRGTHVSAQNNFEEADFPEVKNSTWIAEDSGEKIYEDLTYSFVTSAATCQRLAKIELETARQGIVVQFLARLDAYQAEPGEWVALTFSELGWSSKLFEVVRSALVIDEDPAGNPFFAVRLVLRETASAVYDWNSGLETQVDPAPNTDLPNPFTVADPTSLTLDSGTSRLYIRNDGTIFSRLYCSWTAAADAFVVNGGYYELQFKKTADSNWQDAGDVPGSSSNYYILDVHDGVSYDVRIRSVSAMGQRGNWVTQTGHTVVGKTASPSNVTGFTATAEGFGVKLRWNAVSDLDVREYEIRYGATGSSWASLSSTAIRVRSTDFYFKTFPAGTTRFRLRAIDTSGNYSASDSTADFEVDAPSAVQNLTTSLIDNQVLIDWEDPETGTFPIAGFNVYKDGGSGTVLLGQVKGTFFAYIEQFRGSYTYTVEAVDTAGNAGTQSSVTRTVYPPPDFEFRAMFTIDDVLAGPSWSAQNAVQIGPNSNPSYDKGWLFPVDTDETWEEHFQNNSVTTVQGLIDLGYVYWTQPTPTILGNAFVDLFFDLGVVLPQCILEAEYAVYSLEPGLSPYVVIGWREDPGDPWTYGKNNLRQVAATNFRYVNVRLYSPPANQEIDLGVFKFNTLTVHVKQITDSGSVTVSASDVGGTEVEFSKAFLDINSITVTPEGTVARYATKQFTDVPNPTSFFVLLFDEDGNRVSGDVSWNAKGTVAVI